MHDLKIIELKEFLTKVITKGIIADIWQNILALTLYLYIDGCGSSKVIYQEYSPWRPTVYG